MTTNQKQLSVSDSLIKRYEEMAAVSFKDHVVTERLNQGMFRAWRCQAPGSWNMGFDVFTQPGDLVVTGDLGDLIVSRCEDMISWSRSAVHSIGYFAEKVPHSIPTREWSYDKAMEWIGEEIKEASADDSEDDSTEKCPRCGKFVAVVAETGKLATHDYPPGCRMVCRGSGEIVSRRHKLIELRNQLETEGINGEMCEHEFLTTLYSTSLLDGQDFPNFKVYNSNFLWCREAVKWLLAHLPEQQSNA